MDKELIVKKYSILYGSEFKFDIKRHDVLVYRADVGSGIFGATKWLIIDNKDYTNADIFDNFVLEGLIVTDENGLTGVLNSNCEFIIPYKYTEIRYNKYNMSYIICDGNFKYGIVSKSGKVLLKTKYSVLYSLDGLKNALVIGKTWNKQGVSTLSGKEIVPQIYSNIQYALGVFIVNDKGGRMGIILKSGDMIVPCKYSFIGEPKHNRIRVLDGVNYGYMDRNFKEVIPCKFDFAKDFMASGYADVTYNGGECAIDINGNIMK